MERLAALEAEVKAEADAQRARKEAALVKVKEQRAQQQAERDALRSRQAELVTRKKRVTPAVHEVEEVADEPPRRRGDLGGALELATKAQGLKEELVRSPKAGEKSWVKSGLASMVLGPIGWLYAGSFREAIPATAAWLAFAALASSLPTLILFPVLMVVMPLSGIAGALYAVQYNRKGSRQRLFGDKGKKKQLPSG